MDKLNIHEGTIWNSSATKQALYNSDDLTAVTHLHSAVRCLQKDATDQHANWNSSLQNGRQVRGCKAYGPVH
jgi:hypothetical protein